MANVTDFAFRSMIAKYGKPDVMWNEFVSADGLVSRGREKLLIDLKFSKKERPIVAQLFTGHPEAMRKAAALCQELGFDGVDINMGCPDRAVEKQGGGAASMRDPKNAMAVLEAAREGAGKIPVTIKTRIGYNRVDFDWVRIVLEQKLPALTFHLRTRKEMSDVPAHWELMPEIVKMRDEISPETLIIGNGDVESVADGAEKIKKYGCDGVMIGRGIFGTPWLFEGIDLLRAKKEAGKKSKKGAAEFGVGENQGRNQVAGSLAGGESFSNKVIFDENLVKYHNAQKTRSPAERLNIMVEHAKLFEKTFCSKNGTKKGQKPFKNFAVMKKHFKAYVSGWDGAKELRVKLMETENARQVAKIVKEYLAVDKSVVFL